MTTEQSKTTQALTVAGKWPIRIFFLAGLVAFGRALYSSSWLAFAVGLVSWLFGAALFTFFVALGVLAEAAKEMKEAEGEKTPPAADPVRRNSGRIV